MIDQSIDQLIARVKEMQTKFIIVTGGVCSSIGKGVLTSSIGVLLKSSGYKLSVIKCDPYLNVDPGTMSPLEHGEVFVTNDGAETDLDLGHYERMLGIHLAQDSSISSGQIFQEVLEGERKGKYLGKCIQLVPHAANTVKQRLLEFALKHEVEYVLVEIGGTVGDMEGDLFLEAIRQLRMELGRQVMLAHLSYVPHLEWTGEVKTKPTQHSVMELKKAGLVPDCLFLRTEQPIPEKSVEKVALTCGVGRDFIFQVLTFEALAKLFVDLNEQNLCARIQQHFNHEEIKKADLSFWQTYISLIEQSSKELNIGLIAKYVGANDPYISIIEALKTAGFYQQRRVKVTVIDAELLEPGQEEHDQAWQQLKELDAILVPGGFDKRGVEGKVLAATWARENNVPFFGICLGMQVMLIEAARSLVGLEGANSTEIDPKTKHAVISLLDEQRGVTRKGASMRRGAYPCTMQPATKAQAAYGKPVIYERHRHRYEVNNAYRKSYEDAGLVFSGVYRDKELVEIAEFPDHRFMLGVQFHPEFCSTPRSPHPLFSAFVKAAVERKQQ
ncbi:MAG: CTP synthase [Epsilonproteobacteria bacterium]|nr:CTP synthase [Campylobacterota bacterium]